MGSIKTHQDKVTELFHCDSNAYLGKNGHSFPACVRKALNDAMIQRCTVLNSLTFETWLDAIISDNGEFVENILSAVTPEEKNYLINSSFGFESEERTNLTKFCSEFRLPMFIAVGSGSSRCLDILLQHGACVEQHDDGRNIMHALVWAAYIWPNQEKKCHEIFYFLQKNIPKDIFTSLLLQEDNLRLRPVELAAALGVLPLIQAIFSVDGIYRHVRKSHGLRKLVYYDVTEYHFSNSSDKERFYKSPLLMLAFLKPAVLGRPTTPMILSSSAMDTWIEASLKNMTIPIVISGLMRVFYAVIFCFTVMATFHEITQSQTRRLAAAASNTTSHLAAAATNVTCSAAQSIAISGEIENKSFVFGCQMFVSITCLIAILNEILTTVTVHCLSWKPKYKFARLMMSDSKTIVSANIYRIFSFLHAVLVLLALPLSGHVVESLNEPPMIILALIYLTFSFACILNVWFVLYIVQLAPRIGYFVVVFQKMMLDMSRFSVIFILVIIQFAFVFYALLAETCNNDFPDFIWSFYSTFKIMLNTINVTGYVEQTDPRVLALAVQHLLYVFTIAILLLNFLIGIMTSSVSILHENRQVISVLQKISVVTEFERVFHFYPACMKRWWTIGFVREEDKVYLPVWENKPDGELFE
ncbi:uncharacterized protein LOC106165213 [Lingula anatina]|uniref:Uncharacterized protein LOC106165213 n=1 Tax=Lingula anatina TaxID=7574 RepID=A0A1S3IKL1_LINAN|nr:uncharacterized protein LOC106165213 [Lingula anatina]|eukprot:XP_013398780.1 uncharacterized protein LOC106165213 [Lingula anatina]